MTSAADKIPGLIAEIDRIAPLLEKVSDSGAVSAEDARLAVEALRQLRARLEALAAG